MQLGFYIDQSRCTGCHTCVVACKDWNDLPAGSANWRWVSSVERGAYPKVFVGFASLSCLHCEDPTCVQACPVNAISKRDDDGIVVVDRDLCQGNLECSMFCKHACPYEVPQFGQEEGAKMQMCDLCAERWQESKKPICVDACPLRALDAGPLEELESRYGDLKEVMGFLYAEETRPSVVFKARNPELLQ